METPQCETSGQTLLLIILAICLISVFVKVEIANGTATAIYPSRPTAARDFTGQ